MKVLKALMDRADFKLRIFHSREHSCPLIGDCQLVSGKPARIEVALNSIGDVGAIRVVDEASSTEIFSCAVQCNDFSSSAKWASAKSLSKEHAANAVQDLTSEFSFIKPGNSVESDAFDHFMAFGMTTTGSK
ncbi:hypothetical protein [Shimia sp. MIT1388]|uniref:hypothetical protein n=1 Tax=Shimia sp. MIT1388 TaxID=3096992 RepID=UPI00399BF6AF